MPIRSLRLVSLCAVSLLVAPDLSHAQAPAIPPEPGAALAPQAPEQPAPINSFDLNSALVSDSGGLTADQVAKLAVERSYQVTSAEALAESARWEAKSQWVNFLPTLSVFGQYKPAIERSAAAIAPGCECSISGINSAWFACASAAPTMPGAR